MKTFIDAKQVADLIGFNSPSHFHRNRERLEDDHAFPVPMPTCIRPMLWRSSEIQAWIDRNGVPKAETLMSPEEILGMGGNIRLLRAAAQA